MNPHESARFWEKVIKGPGPSACWIWTGAIGDDGYGRFWTQTERNLPIPLPFPAQAYEHIHPRTQNIRDRWHQTIHQRNRQGCENRYQEKPRYKQQPYPYRRLITCNLQRRK